MSREVVSNDMNFPTARLTGHEVSEKGNELLTGMSRSCTTNDLSCLGVQRGVQREGAVTAVSVAQSISPGTAAAAAPMIPPRSA